MQRPRPRIELGHQLYPILEQCRKPEVLWAKLASGNYDWLGVRRNGKFVVGRPRLSDIVPEDPTPRPDDVREPTASNVWPPCSESRDGRRTRLRTTPGTPSWGW